MIVSNNVVAIAAGERHSLFVKSDGSLWGMGYRGGGQLGNGTASTKYRPELIVSNHVVTADGGESHSLFLKSDGSVWIMGGNMGYGGTGTSRLPKRVIANGVIAIACGRLHDMFLKSDGSLWVMGYYGFGQLGDGFNTAASVPEQILPRLQPILAPPVLLADQIQPTVTNVAAGSFCSMFIKSDGSLWAMGLNAYGQLGDGTFNCTNLPEQIVSEAVTAVAAPSFFNPAAPPTANPSLFLKSDSSLWGTGYNYLGQLGNGTYDTPNRPLQIVPEGVIATAVGKSCTLFLKSNGSLWATGDNDYGQLGNRITITNRPQQIISNGVVTIAAGSGQTAFLKSDGSLWVMGATSYTEYGTPGDTTNSPQQIVSNGVVAVTVGISHLMFVKSGGSLWGMGYNASGQLGDGTFNTATVPEQIVSNGVVAVSAGAYHTVFIKSDGSLWAMGNNRYGQLGDGTLNTTNNRPEQIVSRGVVAASAGYNHTLFVKSDGSLWGMGDNYYGELGNSSRRSPYPEKVVGGAWVRGTCLSGGTYRLLSGTNISQPVNQWQRVWTNTIVFRGSNNFAAPILDPVPSGTARRFYILQAQ